MKRGTDDNKQWSVVVENLNSVLDAYEWCKVHKSRGTYDFKWMINQHPNGEIVGWFAFSNHDDMVLFSLRWC